MGFHKPLEIVIFQPRSLYWRCRRRWRLRQRDMHTVSLSLVLKMWRREEEPVETRNDPCTPARLHPCTTRSEACGAPPVHWKSHSQSSPVLLQDRVTQNVSCIKTAIIHVGPSRYRAENGVNRRLGAAPLQSLRIQRLSSLADLWPSRLILRSLLKKYLNYFYHMAVSLSGCKSTLGQCFAFTSRHLWLMMSLATMIVGI